MSTRRPWLLPLLAIVLVGCGGLIHATPAAVRDREALPGCGEERLEQGGRPDAAARQCLLDAFQSGDRQAELISTRPTIEGDPITTIYRARVADGEPFVELFVDSTRDSFGSGHWTHQLCRALEPTGGEWVFEPVDCDSPTPL